MLVITARSARAHTHIDLHAHTRIYTDMRIYTHTNLHTHIFTRTSIYTLVHTGTRFLDGFMEQDFEKDERRPCCEYCGAVTGVGYGLLESSAC